jgi:hypothetical protein
MSIQLKEIIPLGRSFNEYVSQFALSETDLAKKILDCGGGPSSFIYQMKHRNQQAISIDPIYQFTSAEIEQRIDETFPNIVAQAKANIDKFVWKNFKSPDELAADRMAAMKMFLNDFEIGKKEGRYLTAALPTLPFSDNQFDLALNSHLLFVYTNILSLDFHISAITEMLRVATEIRIFPLVDMNSNRSPYVDQIVQIFKENNFQVSIVTVDYEFNKGGNQFLKINK